MTAEEPGKKGGKKADRFILIFFLLLILVPVFLYLIKPDHPDRIGRLYFSGYMLMATTIYYSIKVIRRYLRKQKPPILEKLLRGSQSLTVFPQEYQDLIVAVKRSLQSRRYFERRLAGRLLAILQSQPSGHPASEEAFRLLSVGGKGPDEDRIPTKKRDRTGLWNRLSFQGVPAAELERIVELLKENS